MRWFLVRSLVSLLIVLPLGVLVLFPTLWRCLTIVHSDDFERFVLQGRTIYFSRDASPHQRAVLANYVAVASDRIRQFWGGQQGRAVVIYCPTQAQYARYCSGGEGAGCSLGMPWGDSFLVLGPEGNSADVIAHELCHDELFARLGWLTVKRQVPQWFNEGLALMVDYRFGNGISDARERFLSYDMEWKYRAYGPHGLSPQVVPPLSSLETTRDFFYGDYSRVMLAYLTAGREVSRWLATVGPSALPRLLADLSAGRSFEAVYPFVPAKQVRSPAKHSADSLSTTNLPVYNVLVPARPAMKLLPSCVTRGTGGFLSLYDVPRFIPL